MAAKRQSKPKPEPITKAELIAELKRLSEAQDTVRLLAREFADQIEGALSIHSEQYEEALALLAKRIKAGIKDS